MDRELEGLGWFLIIAGGIMIVLAAVMGGQQDKECEAKGGVLVKIKGGYVCAKNIEEVRP